LQDIWQWACEAPNVIMPAIARTLATIGCQKHATASTASQRQAIACCAPHLHGGGVGTGWAELELLRSSIMRSLPARRAGAHFDEASGSTGRLR